MKQPHIRCTKEDIRKMVLLPGAPERVLKVTKFLKNWKEIAYNREFKTISGYYKEMPVTVTSTGIGGTSTAIAVEELIACGGEYFIRIGSAGAVQADINIGDLIIATGAVREDGASKMYVEEGYPAVADFDITSKLIDSCKEKGYKYYAGIVRSHDSFYIDNEGEIMDYWNKKRVLASDMETSALFTIGNLRGVRVASILNNVVKYRSDIKEGIGDYVDEQKEAEDGENKEILVALEALYKVYIGID